VTAIIPHICLIKTHNELSLERNPPMFEPTTDPRTRYMMNKAHSERAKALRDAWNWIKGSK